MTRLTSDMIKDIPSLLYDIDEYLLMRTGKDLISLAAGDLKIPFIEEVQRKEPIRAAVIPISSGGGIIPGFSEAVSAILTHLGLRSRVTEKADVGGLGEAYEWKADVIFSADDDCFLAVNTHTGGVVENGWATARGFVRSLELAVGLHGNSLKNNDVLVLGLGDVGSHAVRFIMDVGAQAKGYDVDPEKTTKCREISKKFIPVQNLEAALKDCRFILDASPAENIVPETAVGPETIIACPGVPHGLTEGAIEKIGNRFIHENLSIGVAVMAVEAVLS